MAYHKEEYPLGWAALRAKRKRDVEVGKEGCGEPQGTSKSLVLSPGVFEPLPHFFLASPNMMYTACLLGEMRSFHAPDLLSKEFRNGHSRHHLPQILLHISLSNEPTF